MPIHVQYDASGDFVALVYTGSTSFIEWRAVVRSIVAGPQYRSGMCWLSDRRLAEDTPSLEYVRSITDYVSDHAEYFKGCGWAVVTPALADFGMARMTEIMSDQQAITMRAFRDYEEAVRWLRGRSPQPRRREVA